jgi:GAF domain-containing protein
VSADRLTDAVRAVAHFLVAEVPLGTTLQHIAELARDATPPADAVGITLLHGRQRPTTAVYTDDVSPAVDRGQYEDGDGPCLTAYRDHVVVRVDDTRAVADRWPRFSRDAASNGVLSTLSFPLEAGGDTFGALNLYSSSPGSFDPGHEAAMAPFVTQAGVVLANARAYWDAFDLAASLREAMRSRATIEQAKGKIMATNGCTPDDAFDLLVKASQRENVKLRDIADRMVEGRQTAS